MGDKAGAEAQFARARKLSDSELILLRAQGDNNWGVTLRSEGKTEDAAAAFRRALDDDPAFCEAHDNLGGVLWMQKNAAAATSEFQAAVGCDPNLASAHNNLGNALLYSAHDLDGAITQFRAAVTLRPGFALAHLNLAKTLAARHQFPEAESEFRSAIMIQPTLAAAHVGLGLVLAATANNLSPEARAEMEKGLQLDPGLRALIPPSWLAELK
jgi:tetratricopeptide (TPR) repeat protein